MRTFVVSLSILMWLLLLFNIIPLVAGAEPTTYALDFAGSNDYLDCGNDDELKLYDAFTIAYWLKYEQISSDPVIIGNRGGIPNKGYWHTIRVGQQSPSIWYIDVDGGDTELLGTGYQPPLNEWHHVVFTFEYNGTGVNLQLWQNGVDQESIYYAGEKPVSNNTSPTQVGNGASGSSDLNGQLDEILVYNRVISESEALALYNSGLGAYQPTNTTGLVLWLKMDEGTGTTVRDRSGYENDASFSGTVTWVTGISPDWYGIGEFYIQVNYFGNLSAVQLEGFKLSFTVSGSASTTSTTYVYCGSIGKPLEVLGATSWSYDPATQMLTVSITHSSSHIVTVSWQSSASGYFVLSVHVKQDSQPLSSVPVTVKPLAGSKEESQNKSTNLQGVAQFELTYGTYLVKAYYDKKVRTLRVWLTDNKDVGLEFASPPHNPKGDAIILLPFVAFIVALLLLRKRK